MAIVQCTHCPAYYWSFRGDHPPKGYCSVKCYEERRRPGAGAGRKKGPPDAPQTVLLAMYEHRRNAHQSTSILADFGDCEECEQLQGIYADSLAWHQNRAERELRQAQAAERRQGKTKLKAAG